MSINAAKDAEDLRVPAGVTKGNQVAAQDSYKSTAIVLKREREIKIMIIKIRQK